MNKADDGKTIEEKTDICLQCEDRKLRENNIIISGIEEEKEGTVDERRLKDEDKLNKVLSFLDIE